MKKFDFVRIYEDLYGFEKPYSNIEFVVSNNFIKRFLAGWSSVKKEDEWISETKSYDRRTVYRPQNYEQFKKYLKETKINESLGDIDVYHAVPVFDYEIKTDANKPKRLESEGFEMLLALATEMLYDDSKKRDEKTEKHLKRTFVNQTNKIHKEMLADYNEKLQRQQKQ